MKRSMSYLRAAVVGFALVAGGKALYENREKLQSEWQRFRSADGLKDLMGDLSLGNILSSAGSLRKIAGQLNQISQFRQFKQS